MRLKKMLVKVIFWFLARGFIVSSILDSRVRAEIEEWEEGTILLLKVEPFGPELYLKKEAGRLKMSSPSESKENVTIAIYFKNINAALPILTGMVGVAQGFAERRFTSQGDIALSMSVVRCINIVETYLFPSFITKKILKKVPAQEVSTIRVYTNIIFGTWNN